MSVEEEIVGKLKSEFGDQILETSIDNEHRVNVLVQNEKLIDIATFVKHDLGFTIPNMCTGIDYKDKIEVVWHIGHEEGPTLVVLKTHTDRDNAKVAALTPIWRGLDWHERETYDMLGVIFEGHEDLRRLLLPDNWEGYPLREDYIYKKPTYRKPEDF